MKIFAILLVTVLGCSVLSGGEIERVKELTKEVKILNLLNGFELTKKQRITLKKYIREVEKKEGEFEHYLEEKADLFETGLEKSIEILASGNALPPSLRKDISSYNQEVKELHREMQEEIFAIAEQVEGILESQQIQQLKEYVPCLIPPAGKARIGQSDVSEGLIRHLERIRDLPEDVYATQREKIVEKAIEKRKSHMAVLAEFDEDKERERIGDLLDYARGLSDIDFSLNKKEIVAWFKGGEDKKERKNDVLLKIRSFLLDPIILKYL